MEEQWYDKLNNTPIKKLLSDLMKKGILDRWEQTDKEGKRFFIEIK